MAKIAWIGEDGTDTAGPSFTTAYGGIKFPKGEPVEVTDKDTITRARKNPFFEVTGVPGRPPKAPEPIPPVEPVTDVENAG